MAASRLLRTSTAFLVAFALLGTQFAQVSRCETGAAASSPGRPALPLRLASGEEEESKEKKRAPKPPPPPEKKRKDGERKDEGQKDRDQDGGSDCFFDCLFGLLSSGPSEKQASPAIAAVAPAPSPWRIGDAAVLVVLDDQQAAVELWSGPGGASEGYGRVGELVPGNRVRIVEMHMLPGADWVRIAREDGSGPSGWVVAHAIDHPRPPSAPPRPPRTPGERYPGERPRTIFLANVGASRFVGPRDVDVEYTNPVFHVGVSGMRRIGRGLQIGAAAGYATGSGYPQFNYQTSVRNDYPERSRVQIANLGLRIGDHVPIFSGNTRWFWAVGPGFYWLRERATMDYEDLSSGSVGGVGTRVEHLSRLRPGGEVATGLLWRLGGGDDFMGFLVRGSFIAWWSEGKKSLTFDFIGDQTPVGIEIGLLYGHDWF